MKRLDQPKQRWNAPVALALGIVILITVTVFGLGFWAGVSSAQPESRQAGEVFDRSDFRKAQPAFVKMPEELP